MRLLLPIRMAPLTTGRDNNFNLLRLLAALGVFVSHTALITQGREAVPQYMWSLGTISVWVFFAISGFLMIASFERRTSPGDFALARCLRIMPALCLCVIVTVFALGPFISSLGLAGYFADPQTYRFLWGNLSIFAETRDLPGVFENNPAPYAQITFWSLKYEVLCYAALAAFGCLGVFKSRSDFGFFFFMASVFWASLLIIETAFKGLLPEQVFTFNKLAFVFLLGMASFVYRDLIYLSGALLAALIAGTWLFWWTPVFHVLLPLTLVYGTLWLAYIPRGGIRKFNLLGDYSYGVYIFAVPVQQIVVSAAGAQTPLENFALSIVPTLGFAMASWHLVEKPCLRLKLGFGPAYPKRMR